MPIRLSTNASRSEAFARAGRMAMLLDGQWQIPGTKLKFGLDPLIGLIPVAGDIVTAGVGVWIIYQCVRAGVRKRIALLMALVLLADFLVSEVPVIGDGADVLIKSNLINLKIAQRELQGRGLIDAGSPAAVVVAESPAKG